MYQLQRPATALYTYVQAGRYAALPHESFKFVVEVSELANIEQTKSSDKSGLKYFLAALGPGVFRAVFSLAMNRYTVVTGKPLMVGIREKYGKVWAVLAGVFAFLGQCVYGIGNFMGCGLGMNMLFPGLPVKYGGLIALVICAVLF